MAKRKDPLMDEEYMVDTTFNPEAITKKLPGDITGGLKPLSDYMSIPCDRIIEFQGKRGYDFTPWPEEEFNTLVDTIKRVGVVEAITVRNSPTKPGYFEVLAGEHRWRGSRAAGLDSVPAHVMRICDEDTANFVFTITNTLRRTNSLRDKINGWWRYTEQIRYKRSDEIDQMIAEGILPTSLHRDNIKMRQVYRYAKMRELQEEYITLVEEKKLSIEAAEQLVAFSREQRETLLPYRDYIKNVSNVGKLRMLAKGELEEKEWSAETIADLLLPKKDEDQVVTLTHAAKAAKKVFRKRLNPMYYDKMTEIMDEALTMYFEKHPERELTKTLRKK